MNSSSTMFPSSSHSSFDGNLPALLHVLSNSLSGNENNAPDGENSEYRHHHINGQLRKLRTDLSYINDSLNELKKLEDAIKYPLKVVCDGLNTILPNLYRGSLPTTNDADALIDLRKINEVVSNLKFLVRSPYKISSDYNDFLHFTTMEASKISMGDDARNLFDELPKLHMDEHFLRSSTFNDIKQVYRGLDINLKLCLLCFSVFPECAVVKRRILLYWWIGEGFIVLPVAGGGQNPVEEVADEILGEFVKKGFIEPVKKKCKLVPERFKMHPLVRAVVIQLAKEADFFDFGAKGNPTANFLSSHRACVTHEDSSAELTINRSKRHQEQLYTWFNLSDQVLMLKPDWFLKLKNIRVLQMGRWHASSMHHIEMEDTEFLKRLKNMKHLMFFSLQGIYRITELPDTIGSLTSLRILDLRACHNLELISEEIALLKNLTHLDMSDCYLINMMPKGIASLLELQVLKGFIIGNPKSRSPCTLDDLKRLKNLRKLTIRTTWAGFPTNKQVKALQQLNGLRKLKIAWGVNYFDMFLAANTSKPCKTLSKFAIMKKGKTSETLSLLPTNLEKLDLRCFPHKKRPDWLKPSQLMSLKKLYVRGGSLSDLSHVNDQWTVGILRLKYLCDLKIDWAELQASFPELKYLEKVQCPKLTLFPCNERGVWLKR